MQTETSLDEANQAVLVEIYLFTNFLKELSSKKHIERKEIEQINGMYKKIEQKTNSLKNVPEVLVKEFTLMNHEYLSTIQQLMSNQEGIRVLEQDTNLLEQLTSGSLLFYSNSELSERGNFQADNLLNEFYKNLFLANYALKNHSQIRYDFIQPGQGADSFSKKILILLKKLHNFFPDDKQQIALIQDQLVSLKPEIQERIQKGQQFDDETESAQAKQILFLLNSKIFIKICSENQEV